MATKLEEGKFYRCLICGRVYRRGKAKKPYAACGHWAGRQQEISEEEYREIKPCGYGNNHHQGSGKPYDPLEVSS